jgi:hypothetical protein
MFAELHAKVGAIFFAPWARSPICCHPKRNYELYHKITFILLYLVQRQDQNLSLKAFIWSTPGFAARDDRNVLFHPRGDTPGQRTTACSEQPRRTSISAGTHL